MSTDEPRLDSVEYLGDDSPTLGQRAGEAIRAHRVIAGVVLAAAVVVAAAAGLVWWNAKQSAPPPAAAASPLIIVGTTGQGGVVLDRTTGADGHTIATVAIELKASLTDKRSAGRITGIGGPGVTSSTAQGIPPIEPGQTSVGVVTTSLDCSALGDPAAYRLIVDYRPTRAGALPSTLQGSLGGIQTEWAALLGKACG